MQLKNSQRISYIFILLISLILPSCGKRPVTQDNVSDIIITLGGNSHFQSQFEPILREFSQAYPSIQVQFVPVDDVLSTFPLDYEQLASFADVLILQGPIPAENSFSFLDLQPILEGDSYFDSSAFWPGSLEGCESNGRLTGIPTTVSPLLVAYRPAMFDELNLPYPSPGWEWEEFAQAAQSLTTQVNGEIMRYGYNGTTTLLIPGIEAELKQNSQYNPAALAELLDWYVSLAKSGAVPDRQNDAAGENMDYISEGKVGMWITSLSSLKQENQTLGDDVGIAPFPAPGGLSTTQTNIAGTKCAMVTAGTQYPQQAWTFINFLTTQNLPEPETIVSLPARIAVAEESTLWQSLDQSSQVAIQYALEHAWYGEWYSEPFATIGEALNKAIVGDKPLADVLAEIEVGLASTPIPTPEATSLPVSTPQPTATPFVIPDDRTVVNFFMYQPYQSSMEILESLAADFNQEHPDIFVQVADIESANLPYADISNVSELFDCFAYASTMSEYAEPMVTSLEPLIAVDPEWNILEADLPAAQLELSRYNGDLYGLPIASQMNVMYYNKNIFAEAGLTPPQHDWNLDDFWELATLASAEGIYGFSPIDGYYFVNYLLKANGVELYDLTITNPQIHFNSPAAVSLLTQLQTLAKNKVMISLRLPYGSDRGNQNAWYHAVDTGTAAMWNNIAGLEFGDYFPPEGPDFEVGVAPMPKIEELLPPDYSGVSLYISRQASNPAACWEWNKYLTTHPEAFNGIPVRSSILESTAYENIVGAERAEAYRAALQQPHEKADLSAYDNSYSIYGLLLWWPETLGAIFDGVSPNQALAELQLKADAYLECLLSSSNPLEYDTGKVCAKEVYPDFAYPDN